MTSNHPPEPLPRARRSLSGIADQAENALHKASRRVLFGIAAAIVLAVALSSVAFSLSVSTAAESYAQGASQREQAGRDQLASANTARALRGLPPFPDPGPDASPDLLWLTAARAWQAVDVADGPVPGGLPQPGVSTPAPSGSFPRPGR